MKKTLKITTTTSRNELLDLWEKYSKLVESDQDEEAIDKANLLIGEIESKLPFADKNEHSYWLDVLSSYKFWEDFEELTLGIIERATNEDIKDLLSSYNKVALDVAKDSNFYDLFNTFSKLSHSWVDTMEGWSSWWEKMSKREDDLQFFLDTYKEIYGKDFNRDDIFHQFYGFEMTCHPMFYANTEEGKNDLIDCIFERYVEGLKDLEDEEELWFYQRLIKELI